MSLRSFLPRSSRLVLSGFTAIAVSVVGLAGCSASSGAPAGSQCFLAVDCAAGLICLLQGTTRVCSRNITSVETEIDSGMDAGPGDTGPVKIPEASPTTGDSGMKTNVDSAAPPPDDAGGAVDAKSG